MSWFVLIVCRSQAYVFIYLFHFLGLCAGALECAQCAACTCAHDGIKLKKIDRPNAGASARRVMRKTERANGRREENKKWYNEEEGERRNTLARRKRT